MQPVSPSLGWELEGVTHAEALAWRRRSLP
jgi:hypothetical protein